MAELQFFDTTISSSGLSLTGTIAPSINLVPQNVEDSGRIGRKIVIKEILFNGVYTIPGAVGSLELTNSTVRQLVYVDHQTNGAALTVSDLLVAAQFLSFPNLTKEGRFTVLDDRLIDLNSFAGGDDRSYPANTAFALQFPCNIPVLFDGATGAITEITANNVGILFIISKLIVGIDSRVRIRYVG